MKFRQLYHKRLFHENPLEVQQPLKKALDTRNFFVHVNHLQPARQSDTRYKVPEILHDDDRSFAAIAK